MVRVRIVGGVLEISAGLNFFAAEEGMAGCRLLGLGLGFVDKKNLRQYLRAKFRVMRLLSKIKYKNCISDSPTHHQPKKMSQESDNPSLAPPQDRFETMFFKLPIYSILAEI